MTNESQVTNLENNSSYVVPANVQGTRAFLVTTSDSTTFSPSTLYVGTEGNLRVLTVGGDDVVYSNVSAGFFPIIVTKVFATNTTASNIIRQN